MNTPLNSPRYSTASIALHWAMLVLMVAVYAFINIADFFPKGSDARLWAKNWHFTLGLLVLAVVWLCIAVRALGTTPPIHPTPPAWQQTAVANPFPFSAWSCRPCWRPTRSWATRSRKCMNSVATWVMR